MDQDERDPSLQESPEDHASWNRSFRVETLGERLQMLVSTGPADIAPPGLVDRVPPEVIGSGIFLKNWAGLSHKYLSRKKYMQKYQFLTKGKYNVFKGGDGDDFKESIRSLLGNSYGLYLNKHYTPSHTHTHSLKMIVLGAEW